MISRRTYLSFLLASFVALFIGVNSVPLAIATRSNLAKPHPLPITLVHWKDLQDHGDYFDQIKQVEVGYLIWSKFPVKVYVDQDDQEKTTAWFNAVSQAVKEWNVYLPLTIVKQAETADIRILAQTPPLRLSNQGNLIRARTAQTRFELYMDQTQTGEKFLSHRFTIQLSPNQIPLYLLACARHEIGHALGIWGHSRLETDVLYFSQVRNPPLISDRDVNTLKRIYEQPTLLYQFTMKIH